MQENFEYVFNSNLIFLTPFFLQDLLWEHLHEEHNTVILNKYKSCPRNFGHTNITSVQVVNI
jgi:hypothetical protein